MAFKDFIGTVKPTASVYFLVLVNLMPIAGVILFGWDVATIMAIYWLENVILGVLNIPKMWACSGGIGEKLFITIFFSFHYGMFCWGHMSFLNDMFDTQAIFDGLLDGGPILWTAISLTASHFFSMIVNFFAKKEYIDRQAALQMFAPYARIMALHVVLIFGGFLVMLFGAPLFALILLIGIKIVMDLVTHTIEHGDIKMVRPPKDT